MMNLKLDNRNKPKSGSRRGVATVEMALIAPFIFLLLFGSFEFSRMMMVRQAMTNAARDGCRHACLATTLNTNDADQVVRDRLAAVVQGATSPSTVRVVFTPSFTASPATGTAITGHVEVDCADISWLPPMFFAGSRISGRASMIRE